MYKKYIKRMIDIILSLLGLVMGTWLYLIIIIAIKVDDPGSVFFTQKRVGIHKKCFNLIKFRTMKTFTPHDMPTHLLENPGQYITRVGRFLRKTSLDEIPQLWNILKGNMSIIGPRPALWNQYDLLEQRDKYGANDIRPGLSGWAQICGRDELEIEDKARMDGEYVKKMSFLFDCRCFFGTVFSVLKKDGVVEGGTGELKKKASDNHQHRILLVANVAKEHVLKFHIPTIRALKADGWCVDVACSGDEQVPYCDCQYHMSYKRSPFTLDTFKGIAELKKIINDGRYDIVYCHTPVGGMAARLASINARKMGTKVIYFVHGYHFFKGAPKRNWILYYPMEKLMSRMTDSIITSNYEDYSFTKKKFKTDRVYQINGLGVDMSRFDVVDRENIRKKYRKQMGIPQEATVLIYLAELIPNKNQTFLMDVLKKVLEIDKNVYLVLAGFDHTDGEFERYAEKLGIKKHVKFLGWREDVGNLYAMSDICTAVSIREGFGLNLVEAMACGIPVIATINRGHETIIRNGENGFLIKLGDIDGFADRIHLLMHNDELREKFIQTSSKEKNTYSSETVIADIKSVLAENL